jgi:hypothetical protein
MNIYDPDEDYLDRHHGEGPDDWYGADDLEQLTEIVGQRDIFGGEVWVAIFAVTAIGMALR